MPLTVPNLDRAKPHTLIGHTISVLAMVGKVGIMVDVIVLNVRNAWGARGYPHYGQRRGRRTRLGIP